MPNTTIDVLEVKIKASANDAASALDRLATSLKNVKSALSATKADSQTVSQKLSRSIADLDNVLRGINTSGIKNLNQLSSALQRYANAAAKAKGLKTGTSISQSVKDAQKAIGIPMKDTMATSPGGSADVKQTTKNVSELGEEVEKAGQKAKRATGVFGKLLKSIGRIAFYRAIRSALKAVGEAFSEGLKNAYMFSKQDDSFKRLADTLDRMASKTAQMKNQLGALLGEFKQFIQPAVEWVVEKVRWASERLTELFAALNGEQTYLQAQLVAVEWEEATDAVKKYKNQLLGLDELNNLTTNQSGKGDETDYSTLYKEVGVNKRLSEIVGNIKEFTIGVDDILFDWDNLTGMEIAQKVIAGIGGLIGGVVGFSFGGVPGAIVGSIAGVVVGATIAELFFEGEKDKYDKKELRSILYPALGALTGAWIGFKASGLTGALVGMTVGATLGFVLSKLSYSKDKGLTYSKDGLANQLIGSALVGIMGAWIGFKVGGITGALIGLTLGATLGLVLNKLFFGQEVGKLSKESLANQIIGSALVGITGGLIGFAVGGVPGALLGMSFGITLTMLIQSIDWKKANDAVVSKAKEGLQKITDGIDAEAATITTPITGSIIQLNPVPDIANSLKEGLEDTRSPLEKLKDLFSFNAMGGINTPGTLFFAGEAGPEFVGAMGNASAVANTEQMTDAIYKAAYMGMSRALQENGGMSGFEPASTDDLFIAMKKKSSAYTKKTGQSAFA